MEATTTTMDPLTVAYLRHVGPYTQVGDTWGQLCVWAGPRGLLGPATRMLGLAYDDPDTTPADQLRYDACIVVDAGFQPDGDVEVQQTHGGPYVTAEHRGPYTTLAETYDAFFEAWFPNHPHEPDPDHPCLEFYLNDPQTTPEADLRTAIYVPLKG